MRYFILALLFRASAASALFASISCPNQDCPASVGELISVHEPSGEDHCGATLVDADLVLTAFHCLPDAIQTSGASCAGKVSLFFPPTQSFKAEVLNCERVESVTPRPPHDGVNDLPDWALLRLSAPSKRTPARVRQRPWPGEEAVHGFALEMSPLFGADDLRRLTCRVVNMGYLFQLAGPGPTPLFTAADCAREIQYGFSGTGLFDDAGDLVGILTSAIDTLSKSHAGLSNRGLLATKTACIPTLVGRTAPECDLDYDDEGLKTVAAALSVLQTLPTSATPSDRTFGWDPPTPETALIRTLEFYPDLDWRQAEKLLKSSPAFAQLFWREYARGFPKFPSCVQAVRPTLSEWEVKLPFTIIAFGDPTTYPTENGLLELTIEDNFQLHPQTMMNILNVHLARTRKDGVTAFNLTRGKDFAEPLDENVAESCRREHEAVLKKCAGGAGNDNPRQHQTPSETCQKLYEKMNWRRYSPPLNLTLPEC